MVDKKDSADTHDNAKEDSLSDVLNKDEINSLLQSNVDPSEQLSGVECLIDTGKVSHERLPMLDTVFERMVNSLTTPLRNFVSNVVELHIENTTSVKLGDYLELISVPEMLAVFKEKSWNTSFLLHMDKEIVFILLDTLLGGNKDNNLDYSDKEKKFTSIERNLVKNFAEIIINELGNSFRIIQDVNFVFERMETNPKFASVVRPVDSAILVNIDITIAEKKGTIQFCIPYASIEPVREKLVQSFMGNKYGQDNIWGNHIENELLNAKLDMSAILGKANLKLKDILQWKKGSTVRLDSKVESDVNICTLGKPVITGKMGQNKGQIAVFLEKNLLVDAETKENTTEIIEEPELKETS